MSQSPRMDNNDQALKGADATQLYPTPETPVVHDFKDDNRLPPIKSITSSLGSDTELSVPGTPTFRDVDGRPQDQVLFPGNHSPTSVHTSALFERTDSPMRYSPVRYSPVPKSQPRLPLYDYRSPGEVKSFVQMYNEDPVGYHRDRMMEIEQYREAHRRARQLPHPRPSPSKGLDHFTTQQKSKLDRRPTYRAAPSRAVVNTAVNAAKHKATATAASAARPTGIEKRTQRKQAAPHDDRTVTPEAKARTRHAPTKKVEGPSGPEAWTLVEDFCPPVSSLDEANLSLIYPELKNASGNGPRPFNFDDDPDRERLSARELELAATLRIPCNKYLLCKRTIFKAKLHALRDKKEFNKTAAQNICSIDVNKTSKLWTAFNHVGWFDEKWFQHAL